MKKAITCVVILGTLIGSSNMTLAHEGSAFWHGTASALVPGLGQALNGEQYTTGGKIKIASMLIMELAALLTTAIVGHNAGFPHVWIGITMFAANHAWSAYDAYVHAPEWNQVSMSGTGMR